MELRDRNMSIYLENDLTRVFSFSIVVGETKYHVVYREL